MRNEGGGFAASIWGDARMQYSSHQSQVTSHSRLLIPGYKSLIPAFKLKLQG